MNDPYVTIAERLQDPEQVWPKALEAKIDNLRVCTIGKIIDFDCEKQTATVQTLIKEYTKGEWLSLPKLLDVPCHFPRAGGYCLTFPVKPDDEVLVIFGDRCIDAWWYCFQFKVRKNLLPTYLTVRKFFWYV